MGARAERLNVSVAWRPAAVRYPTTPREVSKALLVISPCVRTSYAALMIGRPNTTNKSPAGTMRSPEVMVFLRRSGIECSDREHQRAGSHLASPWGAVLPRF